MKSTRERHLAIVAALRAMKSSVGPLIVDLADDDHIGAAASMLTYLDAAKAGLCVHARLSDTRASFTITTAGYALLRYEDGPRRP